MYTFPPLPKDKSEVIRDDDGRLEEDITDCTFPPLPSTGKEEVIREEGGGRLDTIIFPPLPKDKHGVIRDFEEDIDIADCSFPPVASGGKEVIGEGRLEDVVFPPLPKDKNEVIRDDDENLEQDIADSTFPTLPKDKNDAVGDDDENLEEDIFFPPLPKDKLEVIKEDDDNLEEGGDYDESESDEEGWNEGAYVESSDEAEIQDETKISNPVKIVTEVEIDEEEIDNLLEQGLPETRRIPKRKKHPVLFKKDFEYNEKEIIVLEEKGKNTFEVLPGGWIEIRHSSGMPLYLHRKTRVCTLAKPYFLGPGSVRRHSIPLSAIPCLAYRRALVEEEKGTASFAKKSAQSPEKEVVAASTDVEIVDPTPVPVDQNASSDEIIEKSEESAVIPDIPVPDCSLKRKAVEDNIVESKKLKITEEVLSTDDNVPSSDVDTSVETSVTPDVVQQGAEQLPMAKVATAKENNTLYSITSNELREYCKPLFKFKSVKCKRFKTWSARRKHTKEQKRIQLQRPTLPEGVKLISFPIFNGGGSADGAKGWKEYIMNPQGKSAVCILHEFVQHALRKQPTYIFRELENATTPYAATVVVTDMKYGTGYGSSKKQAKADAAKATLEIMIPQIKLHLDGKKPEGDNESYILTFFEPFGLHDLGISKWCNNFSEPPPYGLLLTCLQRNFGQGTSSNVKFDMISTGNQSNKFRMEVGEHNVEVTAANKREGKQLASQHLLSKLHPHITNFGAFIKLYGNSSIKSVKEKKQEEQQITTLQSKASANSPNWAILSKLKEEMRKLCESRQKGKELSEKEVNEKQLKEEIVKKESRENDAKEKEEIGSKEKEIILNSDAITVIESVDNDEEEGEISE